MFALYVLPYPSRLLYLLLTEREMYRLPVLIVCNKQDQLLAKSRDIVKSLLEKEMLEFI